MNHHSVSEIFQYISTETDASHRESWNPNIEMEGTTIMDRTVRLGMLFLLFLFFGALSGVVTHEAFAKMYKWVDENGVAHYSEFPPDDQKIEHEYETVKSSEPTIAEDNQDDALVEGVDDSNFDSVEKNIEKGADVNSTDRHGWTFLMKAASKGDLKMARLLIDGGADINVPARNGVSALYLASSNGRIKVVKLLLEKGADPEASNSYNETAIMHALWGKHFDVAKLLADAGADLERQNKYGATACKIVGFHGDKETLEHFKNLGCP